MRKRMIAAVAAGALLAGGGTFALAEGMPGQMPMPGQGQPLMQGQMPMAGQMGCPMMGIMGPGMMMGQGGAPGMGMGPTMGMGPMMGMGQGRPGAPDMMGGGMVGGMGMGQTAPCAPGMMSPGMMGPAMMGSGMMGSGIMGSGMMGGGALGGMGPRMGMMHGMSGMHPLVRDLSVEDVTHVLTHRLEWMDNPNLKLGEVVAQGDDLIIAQIVTKEGSLVWTLEFDRHTGMIRPAGEEQ